MNTKLLIDSIVRQTTVLIAQLSTAGGVRAPLAQLADQVFLSLTREIEAQGIARKVVADMFGLALRGYQRKTQRLAQSNSEQGKTLVEAVLEFVEREGGANRAAILQRFRNDGERESIGVLSDLVQSGLLHATGAGEQTLYGVTSDAERQRFTRQSDQAALANMLLGEVYRSKGLDTGALAARFGVERVALDAALGVLVSEGRLELDETSALYRARTFQLGEDAAGGWENSVFDHFQAVATAIANKLQLLARADAASSWVGGTTLRFELHAQHPLKDEALALLRSTRERAEELWARVGHHNDAHPHPAEERATLTFYFGQNVDDPSLLLASQALEQQSL